MRGVADRVHIKCIIAYITVLILMAIKNMLRTHEGKSVLSEKKNQICDFRCNQMPFTGQIKEIAPYVSAYF